VNRTIVIVTGAEALPCGPLTDAVAVNVTGCACAGCAVVIATITAAAEAAATRQTTLLSMPYSSLMWRL
jgi:hypothetical protein